MSLYNVYVYFAELLNIELIGESIFSFQSTESIVINQWILSSFTSFKYYVNISSQAENNKEISFFLGISIHSGNIKVIHIFPSLNTEERLERWIWDYFMYLYLCIHQISKTVINHV